MSAKHEWMTTKDVADLLQVSDITIKHWRVRRRKGERIGPPFHKMNSAGIARRGSVRYRRSEVEAWMVSQRVD